LTLQAAFILALSAYALPTQAAVTDYTKKQKIERAIEMTGFDRLIDALPEFADRALYESRGAVRPETWENVRKAFEEVYIPDQLKAAVRLRLIERYEDAQFKAYLKYLQSPLTRYMAVLEQKANVGADQEKFKEFLMSLEKNPNNDPRSSLAMRLDEASGTTKLTINIQSAFFRSIFMAVDPTLEKDLKLQEGELESMENEVRGSMAETTRRITVATYLYAYRSVSTEKLRRFVEETESLDVRWGNELFAKTLLSVLNDAALSVVDQMRVKKQKR
jgi:hypothetical protein